MTPEEFSAYNPSFIVGMGDVHGNERWMETRLPMIADALDGQEVKLVLQHGDFGFWHEQYLDTVSEVATREGLIVAFLEGNHENYDKLSAVHDGDIATIRENLYWLRRGTRWIWQGRTWMALGGAISPDRAYRSIGRTWFPGEEISLVDAARAIAPGPVDVLCTHDYPPQVPHGIPEDMLPSGWDRGDLALGEYHRRLLERIAGYVMPRWWFHGHAHYEHRSTVRFPWGPVEMAGLNMDGSEGNWRVLDTRNMEWVEVEDVAAD